MTIQDQMIENVAAKIFEHFQGWSGSTFSWQGDDADEYERAKTAHNQKCIELIKVELHPLVSQQEKRWPFVESPGEFTERLRTAIRQFGDLLPAVRNVLIENPAQIKQGADGPLIELTRERLSGVEGPILNHEWRDSPSYGGEICASCGAAKGTTRGMKGCTSPA